MKTTDEIRGLLECIGPDDEKNYYTVISILALLNELEKPLSIATDSEKLLTANRRIEFLESVLEDFRTSDLCRIGAEIANKGTGARISDIEGLTARNISDAGRQIQSLTDKVSELEESLSVVFDVASSNWDSYQMEVLKNEKLHTENTLLLESTNMD